MSIFFYSTGILFLSCEWVLQFFHLLKRLLALPKQSKEIHFITILNSFFFIYSWLFPNPSTNLILTSLATISTGLSGLRIVAGTVLDHSSMTSRCCWLIRPPAPDWGVLCGRGQPCWCLSMASFWNVLAEVRTRVAARSRNTGSRMATCSLWRFIFLLIFFCFRWKETEKNNLIFRTSRVTARNN